MLCKLDARTGCNDGNQLDKYVTWVGSKLILGNANAFARQYYYAGLDKVCNKQEIFLLVDRAHVSGLIAFGVMSSHFTYETIVTSSTQFMGAKVYPTVVFGKSLFALEGFGDEKIIFYVVSRLVEAYEITYYILPTLSSLSWLQLVGSMLLIMFST